MVRHAFTEAEVLKRIRVECNKLGSQKAYAEFCGVGHSYIRRVLCGDRSPTPAILKPLGLKRIVTYVRAA